MHDNINIKDIIDECVPLFRDLAVGRYAVSLGGSRGKGRHDHNSDVDFRLFCDREIEEPDKKARIWEQVKEVINRWEGQGVKIDGCWTRSIKDIDMQIDGWLEGEIRPIDKLWTIWGYHLLTDIHNQQIVEDPYDIILGWKSRIKEYPVKLRNAIIDKHIKSLRYWRSDYHYVNKVKRGDFVFLSGISSKLVYDIMQIVFALNGVYYCGDGNNADSTKGFAIKPCNFEERIKSVLYPYHSESMFVKQREMLAGLIDELEDLLKG